MAGLSQKQQKTLEHDLRKAIYELLQSRRKVQRLPAALGLIAHELEHHEVGLVHYHLQTLVDADLVEKVPGTYAYRVVER